jgi:hypothetical protein
MERIGGDGAALGAQYAEHFHGTKGPVAARRPTRRQSHPGLGGEHVDHLHRRGAAAALVGATQRLAVDRHHAGKLLSVRLGERGHGAPEVMLEGGGVEQPEHPAEGVVARNPVLQPQELLHQRFLRLAKQGHRRRALRAAQCRGQHDD